MSISLNVGDERFEIGSASFFKSFFSTVFLRVEHRRWGSRFPAIMNKLYKGRLAAARCPAALEELAVISRELATLPPHDLVWDFENPTQGPPWGDTISPAITNLANSFVTARGEQLLSVLRDAVQAGAAAQTDVGVG